MRYFRAMAPVTLMPIGVVRSTRVAVTDDGWDAEQSVVEIDPDLMQSDALAGLEEFSHVEVLYWMDRVDPARVEAGARHPRGNRAWPRVGILAQRAKNRPNAIGATVCRILRVDGLRIHVAGLDAVDGSPVLDLKPWVREFGPRGDVSQPGWMTELMREYWGPSP
jgi:tRNA-Thr(GGU) m(6)t(6)A37 methyltransferase TsaA